MSHLRLGEIVKCQIATRRLIRDEQYFDEDILDAQELHLGPDGVVGVCGTQAILNHHHRLNPMRKAWKPNRLLSVGFTGHYAAMSDRFGAAPVGCAAENVIVDCDQIVAAADLESGIQIRCADGSTIDLGGVAVAKPCIPFTKYLLNDQGADVETVAPNRAFLDHGMRGFIMGLEGTGEATVIRPGDELWAASS